MTKITLDVADFKKEMKRIGQEVENLAQANIHDRIDYATEQLRIVTPVDTGAARQGWKNKKTYRADIDSGLIIKEALGISTTNTVALLAAGVGVKQEGTISNDVDYISELNNGHSKQAPKYFIEQVLSKIGLLTPN